MKKLFFNRSKELEVEISEYLDIVNKSVMIFERDVNNFIQKRYELFDDSIDEISEGETAVDKYQKDIKYKLYKYMLIPEASCSCF